MFTRRISPGKQCVSNRYTVDFLFVEKRIHLLGADDQYDYTRMFETE